MTVTPGAAFSFGKPKPLFRVNVKSGQGAGLVVTDIIKANGPITAEAMGMSFEEMIDMFAQESAIKRPNTVEEVAAMAVLLASEAGGGITGATLSVDGGSTPY